MHAVEIFPTVDQDANRRLDAGGRLRHMLALHRLGKLLPRELPGDGRRCQGPLGGLPMRSRLLAVRTRAKPLLEASTHTRACFDLAGERLAADALDLDVNSSSRKKGESILDSTYIRQAMRALLASSGAAVRIPVLDSVSTAMARC